MPREHAPMCKSGEGSGGADGSPAMGERPGGDDAGSTIAPHYGTTAPVGGESGGSSGESSPGLWYRPPSPEEPLDLSAKSSSQAAAGPSSFNVMERTRPRLTMAGRRTYTEDELQAALRDIQSGKLGTRRAAVIYGIPRSTLRNKVYKLSQEARKDDEEEDELSGAEEEREVEKVLMKPLLSLEDVMRVSGDARAWPYLQRLLSAELPPEAAVLKVPAFPPPAPPPPARPPPPPQPAQPAQDKAKAQGGKGTRPKRGKYRNYDRDSLVEAVRAVQRGEMSVHRAGSYYGVPHSTLEYKVKERHLMRPRKREPKPAGVTPPPNGGKAPPPGLYPAPFPFWPVPPPPPNAAPPPPLREMAESLYDGSGENGSFLDGIIRSSLETGLPPGKEPRAGLLDTLCRGADLSPPHPT